MLLVLQVLLAVVALPLLCVLLAIVTGTPDRWLCWALLGALVTAIRSGHALLTGHLYGHRAVSLRAVAQLTVAVCTPAIRAAHGHAARMATTGAERDKGEPTSDEYGTGPHRRRSVADLTMVVCTPTIRRARGGERTRVRTARRHIGEWPAADQDGACPLNGRSIAQLAVVVQAPTIKSAGASHGNVGAGV